MNPKKRGRADMKSKVRYFLLIRLLKLFSGFSEELKKLGIETTLVQWQLGGSKKFSNLQVQILIHVPCWWDRGIVGL